MGFWEGEMISKAPFSGLTKGLLLSTTSLAIFAATNAAAQDNARAARGLEATEEIIITARKRDEGLMHAPVVVQAFTAQQLSDLKISSFNDLAAVTPGLLLKESNQSSTVFFRGVGNNEGALFSDMSILLNVDGLSLISPSFWRNSVFDTQQVEVLKGPQSLFFGRSASAGIISVKSANPTDRWEAQLRGGYEFNADEQRLEGYVSGPITDELGIRLAAYHSKQEGFLTNPNPIATTSRVPNDEANSARLTLEYDNRDIGLRVNFKSAYTSIFANAYGPDITGLFCNGAAPQNSLYGGNAAVCGASQRALGTPRGLPYNPTIDWPNSYGNVAAFAVASPDPLAKDGGAYTDNTNDLTALSIDYDLRPGLRLTSVTGYMDLRVVESGQILLSPTTQFGLVNLTNQHGFSQELRLASDWHDSWFNFVVGGLYSTERNRHYSSLTVPTAPIFTPPPAGTTFIANDFAVVSEVRSAFGQLILTPIDHVEFAAGVRYTSIISDIDRMIYDGNTVGFFPPNAGIVGDIVPFLPQSASHHQEDALSPEVTLTWRPTDDLMAYVAYKQGYRGPGLNVGLLDPFYKPGSAGFYKGEKPMGGEIGVKATTFEHQMAVQATVYYYEYDSMQVSFVDPATFAVSVANGAGARLKGVELALNYAPRQVEGLSFSGNISYNDARYTSFRSAPCYNGQPIGECDYLTFTQDLSGKTLAHAPRLTGQLGVQYQRNVMGDYRFAVLGSINYSSRFQSDPTNNPNGYQKAYATYDAVVRFGRQDGLWELALIGRNLSNEYYVSSGVDEPTPGLPGTPSDVTVFINRPRQIMLQLTIRPPL